MPPLVTLGATLKCTMGSAPAKLMVIPKGPPVLTESKPQATIMDFAPMANILPFGTCMSLANPTVAAATAAALGALTPMPCIPMTVAPWVPGAVKTLVNSFPALTQPCKCMCNWGGVISIVDPGTTKEQAS